MENEKKTVVCPCCGTELPADETFCKECGARLKDQNGDSLNIYAPPTPPEDPGMTGFMTGFMADSGEQIGILPDDQKMQEAAAGPEGPSDKDLKLIVDCCRKVIATAMGDGHDEVVLYLDEKTGEYQIHTYDLYVGARREIHRGYRADREAYDQVMELIEELDLKQYEGRQEICMTGGEFVVKFLRDGRVIRISTDNVPYEKHSALYSVGTLLGKYIDKEKELH